jgi:hypothetical protein
MSLITLKIEKGFNKLKKNYVFCFSRFAAGKRMLFNISLYPAEFG